ncbi:hypothetical protein BLNAU_23170 [Blattamonas nauphoetae]|uniref:Uncharacterized protein n=1 Tax=Blattamonas nauphoetae TaxID=2049346 RepID=A0ABQ9WU09_9EUKA|nr:hypothetical protein BLNAU_23170 [Blattamonas nauphoetae]
MLPGLRQLADMKVELVKLLTALRDNDEEQLLIYERMRVPGNTQRTIAPLFHIARLTSVATDQILGMDSSEWLGITPPEDQWFPGGALVGNPPPFLTQDMQRSVSPTPDGGRRWTPAPFQNLDHHNHVRFLQPMEEQGSTMADERSFAQGGVMFDGELILMARSLPQFEWIEYDLEDLKERM